MFWYLCLTTLTAMASLPFYRFIGPIIRNRSMNICTKLAAYKLAISSSSSSSLSNRSISLSSSSFDASGSSSSSSSSTTKNGRRSANVIYTRTGDNGSSGLFTGERRSKDDAIFEALGTTDELTSAIGFAREFIPLDSTSTIRDELEQIQCILQDLQAVIATPKSSSNEFQLRRTKWNINHLIDLEAWIEVHSERLPRLRNFILPSGGKASAALHMARAICRRAERRLVPLLDDGLELPVLQYLNRLSSYLFTVARVCSREEGFEETIYRRQRPQDDEENDAAPAE